LLLADCFQRWSLKTLIIRFCIVTQTIIVFDLYCAKMVIEIIVMDILSATFGTVWERGRRKSVAPSYPDLNRQLVIYMNKLNE
jgi:hypothetical protein